jgi:hypothetical protein
MSYVDEWTQSIARQLKSEAERVGSQARSELYEDGAREAFIRIVLEPFLPSSYAVASGRVIDASGNVSQPQDIVIYRRDYPQFNMPDRHNVFVYESVVATVQVCSKLVRKSFFGALDRCASLADLDPVIDPAVMKALALKTGMKLNKNKQYVHPDPLNSDRFALIGRPQSFVYSFTGYQTSEHQLADNLTLWTEHFQQEHEVLQLKSLPSVIATQGCFAWRNTAPFSIKNPVLMGIGKDDSPVRLIILHLMHAFNRRLHSTSDGYGIKSSIDPYLAQFERPVMTLTVGTAKHATPQQQPAAAPAAETAPPVQKPAVADVPTAVAKPEKRPSEDSSKVTEPATAAAQSTAPAAIPVEAPVEATPEPPPQPEPVIKDLSAPPRFGTSEAPPSEEKSIADQTKAPLSLYANGEEADGEEEYQFEPVEPPPAQASDEAAEEKSEESAGKSFLTTQEFDTSEIATPEEEEADQFDSTVVMAKPPVVEQTKPVESQEDSEASAEPDSTTQKPPQSGSRHDYVTEQLI